MFKTALVIKPKSFGVRQRVWIHWISCGALANILISLSTDWFIRKCLLQPLSCVEHET